MRHFALGRRFGLIFVAFNSLLHLTTNEALADCFACVREHLAPGGTFAFDVFNPSVTMLARSPAERTTVVRVPDDALGEIHVEATMDYDAATQVNRSAFHFSAPGRPDYLTVPIHLRSLFPLELPLLLTANGLRLEERYGDFGREPFGSGSARQVCICRVADAAGAMTMEPQHPNAAALEALAAELIAMAEEDQRVRGRAVWPRASCSTAIIRGWPRCTTETPCGSRRS